MAASLAAATANRMTPKERRHPGGNSKEYTAMTKQENPSVLHRNGDVPLGNPHRDYSGFLKDSKAFMHSSVSRAAAEAYSQNMALISALITGACFEGLFGELPEQSESDEEEFPTFEYACLHAYHVLWCSSVFANLFATIAFIFVHSTASSSPTDADFNIFLDRLGVWKRAPEVFSILGATLMYFGLLDYIFLCMGMQAAICCIMTCFFLGQLPMMIFSVRFFQAARSVGAVEEQLKTQQQHIYDRLTEYYMEKEGNFFAIDENQFLQKIHTEDGPMAAKVAEKVFQDWCEQKLTMMVKPNPGF